MSRHSSENQRIRTYVESRRADGDATSDIWRAVELKFSRNRPSRSTIYAWAKAWDEERAQDESGVWTLASDETGRPDLVMRVIAALEGRTRGVNSDVTVDEARWLVKLEAAVPSQFDDWISTDDAGDYPAWGALRALNRARDYIATIRRAKRDGDIKPLQELDRFVAVGEINRGRHLHEMARPDDVTLADLYRDSPNLWPDSLRDAQITED